MISDVEKFINNEFIHRFFFFFFFEYIVNKCKLNIHKKIFLYWSNKCITLWIIIQIKLCSKERSFYPI